MNNLNKLQLIGATYNINNINYKIVVVLIKVIKNKICLKQKKSRNQDVHIFNQM